MSWSKRESGLILPAEAPLTPIYLFIDETFTAEGTGFLQACFPVPQNIYDEEIVPRSRELLNKLGQSAKEFKGSSIKKGNISTYREFLYLFTGISADVSGQVPLFPIVSVDGADIYRGQQFERVRWNVAEAMKKLNATEATNIVDEFSRQMLWLYLHLRTIAPSGFQNDFVCTFDAKHRHAKETRETRFFFGEEFSIPVASSLESLLSSCGRTLLSHEHSDMRLPEIGPFRRIRFVRSQEEFGLQVADVLCHLFYCALRKTAGISDRNVDIKTALLAEVMPEFDVDNGLLDSLDVVRTNDDRQDIKIIDLLMRSRFQILPIDADEAN